MATCNTKLSETLATAEDIGVDPSRRLPTPLRTQRQTDALLRPAPDRTNKLLEETDTLQRGNRATRMATTNER
eukprot:9394442-Lingulodinium_polyedra.AAC.1